MQLDLKNLKSYTTEQLYSILSPIIDKVYKYYAFLKLDSVQYKSIVLDTIKKTMNEISNDKLDIFDNKFKDKLTKYLNNYISTISNNEDKFLSITLDFIDNNITSCDTYINHYWNLIN